MRYAGFLSALIILLATVAASGTASAQESRIYVIESNVSSIQAGKEYALAEPMTIPAGGSIRAVMPSGKTQTIKGPHSGPLSELAKGQKVNDRVFSWIKSFLDTGGAQEKTTGAARSAAPPPAPMVFSWNAVPITYDGAVCVVKGRPLELVRTNTQGDGRAIIVDIEKAAKGDARWASGSRSTTWPSDVAIRPDGTFTLLVPDQPARQVTLSVLEQAPSAEDTLSTLAARGCKYQFDTWMKEQAKGKAP
jgi:hypothetical protein